MFEEEIEPLIKIMPDNSSLEDFHLPLRPLVYLDSMIVNGRLYTAYIQDHGQIVNYYVHVDDGLYYTSSKADVCDSVKIAKYKVRELIYARLEKPF